MLPMRNKKQLPIPPRWLKCPRKGGLVAELFLPFKTPLDERYDDQVPLASRFPPEMFLESVDRLGMVVDLTNTTRFYDKHKIEEKRDITYIKLDCKGHSEAPTKEQVQLFNKIVHSFHMRKPLATIGVHCTHGFNRTGFLIVAYLVEMKDWSVDAALDAFTEARPPGIYKADYLEELYKQYDELENAPPPPERPSWCIEDEEVDDNVDDDGNSVYPTGDGGSEEVGADGQKGVRPPPKNPEFMEGVDTVSPETDEKIIRSVQEMCQKMCSWERASFPGSQPVSMDIHNIKLLKKPYKVSWKADGTRYMMLIRDKGEIYMLDRDNCVYKPHKLAFYSATDPSKHLTNTFVDGEMIIDEVDGRQVPRYLIYDLVTLENEPWGEKPFQRRMGAIEHHLIKPRHEKMLQGLIVREKESFSVRIKPFWDIVTVKKLLDGDFSKSLVHKTDGLIFQPAGNDDKYVAGRCETILKWKPPELNSIDFLIKVVRVSRIGCLPELVGELYVTGQAAPYSKIERMPRAQKDLDGKIVECHFDFTKNSWTVMRIRTDKSFPNHLSTAEGVIRSILQPVTKDYLYWAIYDNILASKPHPSKHRQPSSNGGNPPSSSDGHMPPPLTPPIKRQRTTSQDSLPG